MVGRRQKSNQWNCKRARVKRRFAERLGERAKPFAVAFGEDRAAYLIAGRPPPTYFTIQTALFVQADRAVERNPSE